MLKKNAMGSDVIDGFECKPVLLDENKPMMYAEIHLFICDGGRCKEDSSFDISDKVRNIIKELQLDRGEQRVKVTRTHCNGACRYKVFSYAYRNPASKIFKSDNSYYAWKNVQNFSDDTWKEIILALIKGKEPICVKEYFVKSAIYSKEPHLHKTKD